MTDTNGAIPTSYPLADAAFPLMYDAGGRNRDPYAWAEANRESILEELLRHGALLFRGFALETVADFEKFALSVSPDLYGGYEDLPREKGGQKIYKSTPYPPEKIILFHNESSHMHRWPVKQFFYCVQAAQERGETPIVDCRRVYSALAPEVIEKFREKKLMYVRNFIDGFDVNWRDFFQTEDRAEVEQRCAETDTEIEWTATGLTTRKIAPAVARHPETGEELFFNQIQLHHAANLEPELRQAMGELLGEGNFPRGVYYGDGEPIEDELVQHITQLYWDQSVQFPWQESDVLMVDNMLVAHARNPYSGARRIAVAMGRLIDDEDLAKSVV